VEKYYFEKKVVGGVTIEQIVMYSVMDTISGLMLVHPINASNAKEPYASNAK
jgi:hypothetical protein